MYLELGVLHLDDFEVGDVPHGVAVVGDELLLLEVDVSQLAQLAIHNNL